MNKRLKVAMIEKGVRNFDLAKHLGVDPAKVSRIINDWTEPDEALRERIAAFLDVPEETLWSTRQTPLG
jgi:transcriptional regulator with XRE-family HTH domain